VVIRCHVPPEEWGGDTLLLPETEARHALRARRARPAETVEIMDGAGRRAEATLESLPGGAARARILRVRSVPRPCADLGLVVGLPKGDKSDAIVQKAVELGLRRLWMAVTEHAVPRLDAPRRAARVERWRRIAVEAMKQCGRAWLPDLRLFGSLDEALASRPMDDRWLFGSLDPAARPLRRLLEEIERASGTSRLTVLVGPEGDFSIEEQRWLITAGVVPVSFGEAVLRVETAALYAASALVLFFGTESAIGGGPSRHAPSFDEREDRFPSANEAHHPPHREDACE
jgi:16S rRNA (uracil1498-N3)-methyltransferase